MVVGKRRLQDFVERFFAADILSPPENCRGHSFRVGEFGFPTFRMFPFPEFQCSKEL